MEINYISFIIYCFLVANSTSTKIKTITTNGWCSDECYGGCDQRNSICGEIRDSDALGCGCVYCNFDNSTGKCDGFCPLMEGAEYNWINTCVSRVNNPKKDSDCICTTCKTLYDPISRKVTCIGKCFKIGQKCRIKKVPAYTLTRFTKQCVCS